MGWLLSLVIKKIWRIQVTYQELVLFSVCCVGKCQPRRPVDTQAGAGAEGR